MESITKDEFFKLLAANSGIMDVETVKDVYYGLVRTMSKELRGKHIIRLPDWGDFLIKVCKERKSRNVNTKELEILPPKPILRFKADYKLKKYFLSLAEKGL